MSELFLASHSNPIPIELIYRDDLHHWIEQQTELKKNWVRHFLLKDPTGQVLTIPDESGQAVEVVYISLPDADLWDDAALQTKLSRGVYSLTASFNPKRAEQVYLACGLQQYKYSRYKQSETNSVQYVQRPDIDLAFIINQLAAIYLVRDLITTPASDMGPDELEQAARQVADEGKATIKVIKGDNLLKENYPALYTVGKASTREPRLLDMIWGDETHPKITLVGKGVCFDSGGLNIKNPQGMHHMKKDMGGAAFVLGLAKLIMQQALPIRLRVLIPAVENSISGNAFRPLDIIKMRSGKTVEVGNTDAEGRLVLADALVEADSEKPELIIDCATLTGAARVAMGTDVPALFSNRDEVADKVIKLGMALKDPMWQMPLWKPYKSLLKSKIADLSSTGTSSYGGAIIAAVFLSEFLPANSPWIHIDMMAYNLSDRPGRPEGGEAIGLRTLYTFLANEYNEVG